MKEYRVCWILVCTAVLTTAMSILGQAPSAPTAQQQATPPPQAPEIRIRKHVLLVNTPVTAVNAHGEFVYDLDEKDFQVTDNEAPQKIMYLDSGRTPLSLVILVETSSRIAPLLPEMRKTGILFADAMMGPSDEAAVVSFDDSVDTLADFTTNHEIIQKTINDLGEGMESSKLFDAMTEGVTLLSSHLQRQAADDSPERQLVIVILSEAIDVGSEKRLDTVIQHAQLYNISIYSVGIPTTLAKLEAQPKDVRLQITPQGIFRQSGMPGTVQIPETEDIRYGYGNLMNFNLWVLRNVKNQITGNALQVAASGTGGLHIATFGGTSMQNAVDAIGAELHSRYSLTYEPQGANQAGYHKIKVHVKGKNLKVRARPGYYVAPLER